MREPARAGCYEGSVGGALPLDRLKVKVRKIISRVVMESEELQPSFWKGDGSNLRFVPLVHAPSCKREPALAGRLVVDGKTESVSRVAIKGADFVNACLFDVHGVIAPFIV